jgi:hypothetical protein
MDKKEMFVFSHFYDIANFDFVAVESSGKRLFITRTRA